MGAIKSSSDQKKAAAEAANAANASAVNPAEVQRIAQETAVQNIINSLALEQQFAPEQAAVRTESLKALLANLNEGDTAGKTATNRLAELVEQGRGGSLLADAIKAARDDLARGGELPLDVQNAVTRSAIARGGAAGGGRTLGMGRALVPRDLGLTSLALRNQRLDRATQLGQAERQEMEGQARLAEALQGAGNNQYQRLLSLASFGQTLTPPESGLSPGDLASLYLTGQANQTTARLSSAQLRAQNARNTAELYGGVAGAVGNIDWSKIFGGNKSGQTTTGGEG